MIRPLRDEADYDRALAQIEHYFENEPEPGTPEADAFDLLALVIEDYERVIDQVNLASIAERERRTRHDVKARIEEFCALAGHEHIHKGMTSRDLTENVEQLQIRSSLELIRDRIVAALAALVATSAPLLFGAAVVTGFGFCAAFLVAVATITAGVAPGHRAGLLAGVFMVGYLAFSIPAIAAYSA